MAPSLPGRAWCPDAIETRSANSVCRVWLARALAEATGESLTEAIRRALEERLAREMQRRSHSRLEIAVRRVQERLASLPVLDSRVAEELHGYDEHGVPR